MNLKVECPERYPYDVTGIARRYLDDVTTGRKLGKSTWPRLETRLKGIYNHPYNNNILIYRSILVAI